VVSAAEPALQVYLSHQRTLVEAALERVLGRMNSGLPSAVAGAVRHGVLTEGKRLRPILVATAFRESGGSASDEKLYDLAVAVELIHAYSLMHDDLPCMDDAPMRRGKATPHTVFGVEVAARAGAALIPWAAMVSWEGALSLGCTDAKSRAITQVLLDAAGAGGMVGGQALDLLGEGKTLSEEELTQIHRLKTGALLSASLVMGAQAADVSEVVLEGLAEYGRAIGLAFQIADDVLDATSSAEQLGKQPSDADLDKSTYVALLGVAGARERGREVTTLGLAALDRVGLAAPHLRALATYVTERKR